MTWIWFPSPLQALDTTNLKNGVHSKHTHDSKESLCEQSEKPWDPFSSIILMFPKLCSEHSAHQQPSKPPVPVGYLNQSVLSDKTNVWITWCRKRMVPSRWSWSRQSKTLQLPKWRSIKRPIFFHFSSLFDNPFPPSLTVLIFQFSLVLFWKGW